MDTMLNTLHYHSTFLFLGEYGNMILMSSMTTILFLGGWLPPVDNEIFNQIPGFIWFFFKGQFFTFFIFMDKSNIT